MRRRTGGEELCREGGYRSALGTSVFEFPCLGGAVEGVASKFGWIVLVKDDLV